MNIFQRFYNQIIVNCVWSEWEWDATKCSKSCGDGERVKIRKKLVQEKNGGSCNGSATEYTFCNLKPCPGSTLTGCHIWYI